MQNQDQIHPREKLDREIINNLLQGEPDDYQLAELARLRIRYRNFPGARDIQKDLELILQQWQLSEAELYAKTRQIHAVGTVYRDRVQSKDRQDWT